MTSLGLLERERLAALRRYRILDSYPEVPLERIINLVARLFRVPLAMVSFVDQDRIWIKARHGIRTNQMPRDGSFCEQVILSDQVLLVPDAALDSRFAGNGLLRTPTEVRFFAGVPLITLDRHRLGTLAVMDRRPRRDFTYDQQRTLHDLAAIVIDELDLRLTRLPAETAEPEPVHSASAPGRQRIEPRVAYFEPIAITLIGVSPVRLTATLFDMSSSGLGINVAVGLQVSSRVMVDYKQTLFQAEVRYCYPAKGGYHAGLKILQVTNATEGLRELAERLREEQPREFAG